MASTFPGSLRFKHRIGVFVNDPSHSSHHSGLGCRSYNALFYVETSHDGRAATVAMSPVLLEERLLGISSSSNRQPQSYGTRAVNALPGYPGTFEVIATDRIAIRFNRSRENGQNGIATDTRGLRQHWERGLAQEVTDLLRSALAAGQIDRQPRVSLDTMLEWMGTDGSSIEDRQTWLRKDVRVLTGDQPSHKTTEWRDCLRSAKLISIATSLAADGVTPETSLVTCSDAVRIGSSLGRSIADLLNATQGMSPEERVQTRLQSISRISVEHTNDLLGLGYDSEDLDRTTGHYTNLMTRIGVADVGGGIKEDWLDRAWVTARYMRRLNQGEEA